MLSPALADAIFWIAVASCTIAQILILRSAMVAPMSEPSDPHLPKPNRAVEIAWTFVPAVGLAALLWFTWAAIHP
jgi:heme/copper-type cytochrome/quinol oxidase subunit 2